MVAVGGVGGGGGGVVAVGGVGGGERARGGGAAAGGGVRGALAAQMTKPSREMDTSDCQRIVAPAAMLTSAGPLVPLYARPPTLM